LVDHDRGHVVEAEWLDTDRHELVDVLALVVVEALKVVGGAPTIRRRNPIGPLRFGAARRAVRYKVR
jgi:hypothetical protein